jgi:hypothetical protein
MGQLNLRITEAALAHIAELMCRQERGALPAIFFAFAYREVNGEGTLAVEKPAHWRLDVYTKVQIDQFAESYASAGCSLVYDAQGLAVCVPQSQLVAELGGKTLDVKDGRVCIR